MERAASIEEEGAVLAALPEIVRSPRFRGAVASVLLERSGRLLDAGVVLEERPEVFLRPLPQDSASLETWLTLLERRRSQLAHDVSGPATGVLAAIETVLEYEPIPESTRSLLDDARVGILRLTSQLADRASALAGPPNAVAGPLTGLLSRMVEPIAASLDPQGDRLDVRVRGESGEVRFDTVVVEGALAVLIANAWRHRRGQEARVRIEGAMEGELLRITVSDRGRGFDAATLRRAGELGFTTRSSGVGLGLFLLRRAVSARGGVVLLESFEPGAQATVLLPMTPNRR